MKRNHVLQTIVSASSAALVLASACAAAALAELDPVPQAAHAQATQKSALPPATPNTVLQEKFDTIDTDHDGSISRKEASVNKALAAQFDKLDGDHDGTLSLAEFASADDLASIKIERKGYP